MEIKRAASLVLYKNIMKRTSMSIRARDSRKEYFSFLLNVFLFSHLDVTA